MNNDRRSHRFPSWTLGALAPLILGILPLIGSADDPGVAADARLYDQGWILDTVQVAEGPTAGIQRLFASGRFLLPAGDVWQAIPGVGNAGNWPGIKKSILESADEDTTIRGYTLSIPLYADRHYKLRNVHDHERMNLTFTMVPGYGNVREIRGSWTVRAMSDSLTSLEYRLDTDPGVLLIPGFIVRWATTRVIPGTFERIHLVASHPGRPAKASAEIP
jgi:hypothetical protein